MVRIVSPQDAAAQGAASMLRYSNTSSSSLFSTLAGQTTNTSRALFNALGGNAGQTQSIDTILDKQKVDRAKLALYVNAAEQIAQIQSGKANPSTDWHKIMGYAMQKGLAAITFIDDSGALRSLLQSESDLSKFNPQQQQQLYEAFDQIGTMAQKILANETNDGWLAKLKGASNDVYLVANLVIAPQKSTPNNWEQTAVLLATNGQPQKISLDTKGNLQAIDQRFDPALFDLPAAARKRLQDAMATLPDTIRNGTATKEWELAAANFARSRVPFYLEVDMNQYEVDSGTGKLVPGKIIAKENSAANITPAFLKTAPYPDIGDSTVTLKQVAEFIKDKKPYFLDFDASGLLVAKDITSQNLFKYNAARDTSVNALGTGAILSLFA